MTPKTPKHSLGGSIDLKQVLRPIELFQLRQRTIAIQGDFHARYCGVTQTFKHPLRPQKDLNLSLTNNPFSMTSAILRPARNADEWMLQLGSNPASCESTYPSGALLIAMTFNQKGRVHHMHIYGDAIFPQLNINGRREDPHIKVRPASSFPDTGEASLTLEGTMEGLGHKVRAFGKVSAAICPKW